MVYMTLNVLSEIRCYETTQNATTCLIISKLHIWLYKSIRYFILSLNLPWTWDTPWASYSIHRIGFCHERLLAALTYMSRWKSTETNRRHRRDAYRIANIICYIAEWDWVVKWCLVSKPTLGVMYDHVLCLQITKTDIRLKVKLAIS